MLSVTTSADENETKTILYRLTHTHDYFMTLSFVIFNKMAILPHSQKIFYRHNKYNNYNSNNNNKDFIKKKKKERERERK